MTEPALQCWDVQPDGGLFSGHGWLLQGLFESIPEELFRSDISSTELRNKGEGLQARH